MNRALQIDHMPPTPTPRYGYTQGTPRSKSQRAFKNPPALFSWPGGPEEPDGGVENPEGAPVEAPASEAVVRGGALEFDARTAVRGQLAETPADAALAGKSSVHGDLAVAPATLQRDHPAGGWQQRTGNGQGFQCLVVHDVGADAAANVQAVHRLRHCDHRSREDRCSQECGPELHLQIHLLRHVRPFTREFAAGDELFKLRLRTKAPESQIP